MARPARKPDPFLERFRGNFSSLLNWENLDTLWRTLRAQADGWYLYAVGEPIPGGIASAGDTRKFIDAIDVLLHKDHHEDYCGIVYVDDPTNPSSSKFTIRTISACRAAFPTTRPCPAGS